MKTTIRGKEAARSPVRAVSPRQLSNLEVIMLSELYDRASNKRFEDAMADFAGIAELLAENTAPEVEALKRMVDGETELNMIRSKVRAI